VLPSDGPVKAYRLVLGDHSVVRVR
jgi:hypothetical protein